MKNKKITIITLMTIIAAQFSVGITALAAIETSISEPMHTEIVEDDLEKEELEENSGTFENIDTPDEGELEERRIQKEAVNNRGIDLNVRQNTLEIRVPLGSSDEGIKYTIKSSISVTANGEYLYFEDYDVEDIKLSTNVDVISEGGTIDYTIIPTDTSKYNSLRVTDAALDVYYGDTVVFETENKDRFAGVFSVDQGEDYKNNTRLVTASGKSQDNDIIDKSYGNDLYYKLDIFRKDEKDYSDYGLIENDMTGDVNISVRGNERKQDAMKRWDNNTELKQGDIVRTWTADPEYNRAYSGYSANEKGQNHDGYIYYQVWESRLLRLNFSNLEILERSISQTASDEYLDKTVKRSFDGTYEDIREVSFVKYPDRSKLGKTVAEIRVKEYVHYHRAYIEHTFEVPFNIIESRVTADLADEIELPVGTDIELIDPSMFVDAIYEDGEEKDPEDYEIEVLDEYDSSTVGKSDTVMINIISKDDENQNFAESTDITYVWGNTIGNKGVNSKDFESSVSLLRGREDKPLLSANRGTGLSTNSSITTNPRMKLFDTSDIDAPKFEVKSLQNRRAVDTMNHFQSAFLEYDDFKYGDVLVYENDNGNAKSDILSSRNDEMISEVRGYNKAYYELTQQGYYLLKLNQLEVSNQEVLLTVNENITDVSKKILGEITVPENIEESRQIRLELDESSIDVKTVGTDRKAKVFVYETLKTNNKEFMTSYEVPYKVEDGIEVVLKENTIPVGTPSKDLKVSDYIESVNNDGKELDPKDYTVSFDNTINTNLVSSQNTKIKVKVGNNEISKTTKTNVIWGHSIVTKVDDKADSKIDASISLLDKAGQPILVANEGTGLSTDNLYNKPFIAVYRDNSENEIFKESGYESTTRPPVSTMEKWNSELANKEFNYGDVFRYRVNKNSPSTASAMGEKTWASRKEELVKETVGYDMAYYEMTKDGFNLMKLNQIAEDNNALKLDLQVGQSKESINEQIKTKMDLKDKDKNIYRFEGNNIDVSKVGSRTGEIKIYEKLASGGEFMTTMPVSYTVEATLEVELQEISIPMGTKSENIDPNTYVKSVSLNGSKLAPTEYKTSFEKAPNTNKVSTGYKGEVSKQETEIKIEYNKDKVTKIESTETLITWGNTITTSTNGESFTTAAVTLLTDTDKPILMATDGFGFSSSGLQVDPTISAFRGDSQTTLISDGTSTGLGTKSRDNRDKWNTTLAPIDFHYGDVFGYSVKDKNGERTLVSRSEQLVLETKGYEDAYYEMTKNGFRLMHFNQLEVNSKMPVVSINTTIEEMNKTAKEAMTIPKHITNTNDYRFEYASVDTKTSGIKTTQMNVYEKLSTGGEFKTTYEVKYQVNPQLTETYYDVTGEKIKEPKMSNFDFGTKYTPTPENFITVGDDVYSYAGWLAAGKKPGKDKPNTSKVPSFTKEDTIQYIYDKADNLINMTIPTELLFGTDGNSKNITSKNYEIKNNSDKVSTEVSLSEFKKEKSDVKLLSSKDKDPSKTQQSARLNVISNGTEVIKSLTESTKNQTITTLAPGQDTSIGLTGTYFGNLNESTIVHYQMQFKFKVIPN